MPELSKVILIAYMIVFAMYTTMKLTDGSKTIPHIKLQRKDLKIQVSPFGMIHLLHFGKICVLLKNNI
jgi:hypothetical protein